MIHHAHFIRLRYHGPTERQPPRWSATWEGWTGDDRPVRRYIPYTPHRDEVAEQVAFSFVNWLNTGPEGRNPAGDRISLRHVGRVTVAPMGGDDWAILVETRDP